MIRSGMSPLSTEGCLDDNWRRYRRHYDAFIRARYAKASDEKKIATLLRYGGDAAKVAFDSFHLTYYDKKNIKKFLTAFDEHFSPSITQARHSFFRRKQIPFEPYENYLTSLQILSESCSFGNLKESIVRDAFISGIYDRDVRETLFSSGKLDIGTALELCFSIEAINGRSRHSRKKPEKKRWLPCLRKVTQRKGYERALFTETYPYPPFRVFSSWLGKPKGKKIVVSFNDIPEVKCARPSSVESVDLFDNYSDSSLSTYDNVKHDYCNHRLCSRMVTTKALVHRENEPMEDRSCCAESDDAPVIPLDHQELMLRLEQARQAEEQLHQCLMKGSVSSENKAERPKTLRKLRNVYESVKMAGGTEDALDEGKLPEKGVLSPFDEQEEWAKISEIMASFGNLVRESVFITELEKEFQERLGLNLNDSSTSVGASITNIGTWLNSINMSQYEPLFVSFGYDNIDFVNGVLDDTDLKEMGLSEEERKIILESSKSLNNKVSLARNESVNNNNNEENSKESVEDWLERLDLSSYWDTFRKHLYTDMDRVKSVWEVELTAVLEISKAGHRHRIMASLPRSPNQPSIQDINAELSQLKSSMQELEGKVVSTSGTGTLRHSHKKTRPAPQPPGKPQPDLQIRDPSQLLVGVPSTITAQWRHQPHALLSGTLTYHARYLGSTVVKVLRGAESTKKSIQKLKKPLSEQSSSPDIYLAISYHGVKFLSGDTKELVCEHEIRNIHLACQDAEDLTHFAYITKDRATKSHYCHVFSVQTMDQATEVILTLGQAFEVAYQMALREANSSKGNGHTRSFSANLTPITTQPNHNRSHSVNEIKLNGESISNGHASTPAVLMSEDV